MTVSPGPSIVPPLTGPRLGALTETPAVPEVPCPDLPYPDCGEPRLLDMVGGWLACGKPVCCKLAIGVPV
ncbi:hypothetical protein [Actinomadura mexicana]|uniref:Uncharacterized protein n=1 Tax=Actinomadura mexicana TaxID=134959 RepID=A0A238Z919_9ACTN|nr:hypothetical protein [Actinomadura mexicana]SNR79343.1 hypothetical protein SAMN06265355_10727 [Actinomadura mexicana]